MIFQIPWPPSVNHYWERNRNGSVRIGAAGLRFRKAVAEDCRRAGVKRIDGRVKLWLAAFPPDRKKRDIDNLLKAIGDALKYAGAYKDDGQIDDLSIIRCSIIPEGVIGVTLEEIKEC